MGMYTTIDIVIVVNDLEGQAILRLLSLQDDLITDYFGERICALFVEQLGPSQFHIHGRLKDYDDELDNFLQSIAKHIEDKEHVGIYEDDWGTKYNIKIMDGNIIYEPITNDIIYLFDIDGTLTPSKEPMDPEFYTFFLQWVKTHSVILVTGARYSQVEKQIPPELLQLVDTYSCSGNVYHRKGVKEYELVWEHPPELIEFLSKFVKHPDKIDSYIDTRPGMINFAVCGQHITLSKRNIYHAFDNMTHEREKICRFVEKRFPDVNCVIGGQVSVDIYPKGWDKSQVATHLKGEIHFFADNITEGGNDYTLAEKLEYPSQVYGVKDYKDTWETLRRISYETNN